MNTDGPEVQGGRVDTGNSTAPTLSWPAAQCIPELNQDEVHAWSFILDPRSLSLGRLWSTLSPQERERASRFHFERDRVRFIVGRAVLRRLLGEYLAIEPVALRLCAGSRGKPYLDHRDLVGKPEVHFNLSHSGDLGLAAFSLDGPIGVDVEAARSLADASDLVARFFSPREREAFERLPDYEKTAAFYRLWTRKEAWLKATGEGISESLHLVEVTFLPGQEARFSSLPPWASALGSWRLHALEPAAGFIGAAAVPNASKEVRCLAWSGNYE